MKRQLGQDFTGISRIDNQHLKFIELVEELVQAIKNKKLPEHGGTIINL